MIFMSYGTVDVKGSTYKPDKLKRGLHAGPYQLGD